MFETKERFLEETGLIMIQDTPPAIARVVFPNIKNYNNRMTLGERADVLRSIEAYNKPQAAGLVDVNVFSGSSRKVGNVSFPAIQDQWQVSATAIERELSKTELYDDVGDRIKFMADTFNNQTDEYVFKGSDEFGLKGVRHVDHYAALVGTDKKPVSGKGVKYVFASGEAKWDADGATAAGVVKKIKDLDIKMRRDGIYKGKTTILMSAETFNTLDNKYYPNTTLSVIGKLKANDSMVNEGFDIMAVPSMGKDIVLVMRNPSYQKLVFPYDLMPLGKTQEDAVGTWSAAFGWRGCFLILKNAEPMALIPDAVA